MKYNETIPMHYIRKNRETEAVIYLKENGQKAAQKMLCMLHAVDCKYKVLGEITNLEDAVGCNTMIIASESMLIKDEKEYCKIEKELNKKGIKIEVAGSNGKIGEYIDMMLMLSRKGRV